jgi:hypothetical protein
MDATNCHVETMTIEAAAAWWARYCRAPRPHRSTLIRWATRGCRGRRLRAELSGGRWYVTEASLREFHRQTNEPRPDAVDRSAGPTRAAEIAANVQRLEDVLASGDF